MKRFTLIASFGAAVALAPLSAMAMPIDMVYWLDADTLDASLNNGDPVTLWADSTPSSTRVAEDYDPPSGTDASQPPTFNAGVINGHDVVSFDGIDDELVPNATVGGTRLTWSTMGISSGMTVFAVVNPATRGHASNFAAFILGDHNGIIGVNAFDTGSAQTVGLYRHAADAEVTSGVPAGAFIAAYSMTNAAPSAANTRSVSVDGGAAATDSTANTSQTINHLMTIGADEVNRAPSFDPRYSNFTGDLAELIIYNRVLSEAEHQEVGFYLEAKYGLDTAYVPEPAGAAMLLLMTGLVPLVRRRKE